MLSFQAWLREGAGGCAGCCGGGDRGYGLPADGTLYPVASRGGASIEGPSIVRHGRFYYLFVSLDYCCRGANSDYRLAVGRAESITGPYLDRDGVPMLAGGTTTARGSTARATD